MFSIAALAYGVVTWVCHKQPDLFRRYHFNIFCRMFCNMRYSYEKTTKIPNSWLSMPNSKKVIFNPFMPGDLVDAVCLYL